MNSKYSRRTGELTPSAIRRIQERDAYRRFAEKHGWAKPGMRAVRFGKAVNRAVVAQELDDAQS